MGDQEKYDLIIKNTKRKHLKNRDVSLQAL